MNKMKLSEGCRIDISDWQLGTIREPLKSAMLEVLGEAVEESLTGDMAPEIYFEENSGNAQIKLMLEGFCTGGPWVISLKDVVAEFIEQADFSAGFNDDDRTDWENLCSALAEDFRSMASLLDEWANSSRLANNRQPTPLQNDETK